MKFLLIISMIVVVGILMFLLVTYFQSLSVVFDKNKFISENRLLFYDNDGEKIVNTSSINNNYISIDRLPDNLINALISVEDKSFYQHNGINYKRVFAALISNIKAGHFKQGGSTISQQLIKNTHLSNEKSLKRKITELRLTKKLEKEFSKNEILEIYLNTIYFGNNSYGIFNASQNYFGKSPEDLSLEECATLIALIKAPSKYNPVKNLELCKTRRDLVLQIMKNDNKITETEFLNSTQKSIDLSNNAIKNDYSSYLSEVLNELCGILQITENEAFVKNYKIHTYFDPATQDMIVESMKNVDYKSKNIYCGACVLIDNYSNGVNCLYSSTPLLISDMKRQMGSTIKPLLVYSPAIEKGIVNSFSKINDIQTDFDGYSPKNYDGLFKGRISVKQALIESRNIPAVKLYQWAGTDFCKNFINKLNINVKDENQLALALGGMKEGVSLLDIVNAYTVYPNLGEFKDYSFIKAIVDEHGKVIYNNKKTSTKVMSDSTAFLTTDMLRSCSQTGTGKILNTLQFDVACKTGTVGIKTGNSDAYMVAYTQDKSLGFWLGSENNIKLMDRSVTGGSSCGKIAKSVLSQMEKSCNFTVPNSVDLFKLDNISLGNDRIELANEIFPAKYISSIYLKKSNLNIPVSTRFLIPEVENLKITINDNYADISFQAEEYYKYFIFKKSFFNSKVISVIEKTDGLVSVIDDLKPNEICYYEIIPYYVNGKNNIYEGKTIRTRPIFRL